MLSDCYPAVIEGFSDDGSIRLNMYSVYPISELKVLLLVANGVEAVISGSLFLNREVQAKK